MTKHIINVCVYLGDGATRFDNRDPKHKDVSTDADGRATMTAAHLIDAIIIQQINSNDTNQSSPSKPTAQQNPRYPAYTTQSAQRNAQKSRQSPDSSYHNNQGPPSSPPYKPHKTLNRYEAEVAVSLTKEKEKMSHSQSGISVMEQLQREQRIHQQQQQGGFGHPSMHPQGFPHVSSAKGIPRVSPGLPHGSAAMPHGSSALPHGASAVSAGMPHVSAGMPHVSGGMPFASGVRPSISGASSMATMQPQVPHAVPKTQMPVHTHGQPKGHDLPLHPLVQSQGSANANSDKGSSGAVSDCDQSSQSSSNSSNPNRTITLGEHIDAIISQDYHHKIPVGGGTATSSILAQIEKGNAQSSSNSPGPSKDNSVVKLPTNIPSSSDMPRSQVTESLPSGMKASPTSPWKIKKSLQVRQCRFIKKKSMKTYSLE